jgi:uncharacterized RDD family membrane protein YckC
MNTRGWDDEIDILSAENVSFAIEPAGLGSRLTIQGLVITLMMMGALWFVNYITTALAAAGKWMEAIGAALLILAGAILIYGYYFLFEWLWDGQTPGKRWLGLRTVQMNGLPITAWEALVRSILRTLDFLPFMYGIGGFIALLNPHNRRIGDLVAGTVVVRERHEATQQILDIDAAADAFLAAQTAGARSAEVSKKSPENSTAQTVEYSEERALLSKLTDEDRELLHQFLTRSKTQKGTLKGAARERLASSLAMRLAQRMNQPLPAPNQAEAFLEAVASAIRKVEN